MLDRVGSVSKLCAMQMVAVDELQRQQEEGQEVAARNTRSGYLSFVKEQVTTQ